MRTDALFVALLVACGGCSSGSSASSSAGPQDAAPAWAPDGPDTDTWINYAQGFTARFCVECHGPSNAEGLDFTQQAVVATNRDLIRCGVCVTQSPSWQCAASPHAAQFPIEDATGTNPIPTPAERDEFVDWLNLGAP
jgi:hypothetical protein